MSRSACAVLPRFWFEVPEWAPAEPVWQKWLIRDAVHIICDNRPLFQWLFLYEFRQDSLILGSAYIHVAVAQTFLIPLNIFSRRCVVRLAFTYSEYSAVTFRFKIELINHLRRSYEANRLSGASKTYWLFLRVNRLECVHIAKPNGGGSAQCISEFTESCVCLGQGPLVGFRAPVSSGWRQSRKNRTTSSPACWYPKDEEDFVLIQVSCLNPPRKFPKN